MKKTKYYFQKGFAATGIILPILGGLIIVGGITGALLYFQSQQNISQQQQQTKGSCGDGICQPMEKLSGICPEDCQKQPENNGFQNKPSNNGQQSGFCGDGICQEIEKTKGVCAQDCGQQGGSAPVQSNGISQNKPIGSQSGNQATTNVQSGGTQQSSNTQNNVANNNSSQSSAGSSVSGATQTTTQTQQQNTAVSTNTNSTTTQTQQQQDTTAPILSMGFPSGTLTVDTTSAQLSLSTNENATCKYSSTPDTSYYSILNTFSTTGGTSHQTTVSNLSNGQSYAYYIRCQDAFGNANNGDYLITFNIAAKQGFFSSFGRGLISFIQGIVQPIRRIVPIGDTSAPTVPTSLSATAVSSSQINLSWTASTDNTRVTGYIIYRDGTQITTTAGTSYSDTNLTASTAYSYTISAYDAAGNNSSQTSSVSATTQAVAVASINQPVPPANFNSNPTGNSNSNPTGNSTGQNKPQGGSQPGSGGGSGIGSVGGSNSSCDLNKDGNVDSFEQKMCGTISGGSKPNSGGNISGGSSNSSCDLNKDGKVDSTEQRMCGTISGGGSKPNSGGNTSGGSSNSSCDLNKDGTVDSFEQKMCGTISGGSKPNSGGNTSGGSNVPTNTATIPKINVTDTETVQPPLMITFDLHMDPMSQLKNATTDRKADYTTWLNNAKWLLDYVKPYGVKISFLSVGEWMEYCIEDSANCYPVIKSLYESGGMIGTHTHNDYYISSHNWGTVRESSSPSDDDIKKVWESAKTRVDAVISAALNVSDTTTVDIASATHVPNGDNGSIVKIIEILQKYGFTILEGGADQSLVSVFGHIPFNVYRPGTCSTCEDLTNKTPITIPQSQVIGNIGLHVGIPQDGKAPRKQAEILEALVNRKIYSFSGNGTKIWTYGWGVHGSDLNEGSDGRKAIETVIPWIYDQFVSKGLAEFASYPEARDDYLAWETANPGKSSFNYSETSTDYSNYPYSAIANYYLRDAQYDSQITSVPSGVSAFALHAQKMSCSTNSSCSYTGASYKLALIFNAQSSTVVDLSGIFGNVSVYKIRLDTGETTSFSANSINIGKESSVVCAVSDCAGILALESTNPTQTAPTTTTATTATAVASATLSPQSDASPKLALDETNHLLFDAHEKSSIIDVIDVNTLSMLKTITTDTSSWSNIVSQVDGAKNRLLLFSKGLNKFELIDTTTGKKVCDSPSSISGSMAFLDTVNHQVFQSDPNGGNIHLYDYTCKETKTIASNANIMSKVSSSGEIAVFNESSINNITIINLKDGTTADNFVLDDTTTNVDHSSIKLNDSIFVGTNQKNCATAPVLTFHVYDRILKKMKPSNYTLSACVPSQGIKTPFMAGSVYFAPGQAANQTATNLYQVDLNSNTSKIISVPTSAVQYEIDSTGKNIYWIDTNGAVTRQSL